MKASRAFESVPLPLLRGSWACCGMISLYIYVVLRVASLIVIAFARKSYPKLMHCRPSLEISRAMTPKTAVS